MPNLPHVVAITLNWNSYEDTNAFLESIRRLGYPNLDIVVIDNGSKDGSGNVLKQESETETIILSEENRGFSGGMNLGIQYAREVGADHVWILNNDLLFNDTEVLSTLVETSESDTSIGALSPIITDYPETDRLWFTEGKVDHRIGHVWHQTDRPESTELVNNEYIPFCAVLIRMSVFDKLGLLPEEYFLYYEDVDYCQRMKERGYKLVTVPEVTVNHKESQSGGGKYSPFFSYYRTRGQLLYLHNLDKTSLLPFVGAIGYRFSLLPKMIKEGGTESVSAFARGVIDGVFNRSGQGPY